MTLSETQHLPIEQRLALAYTPPDFRDRLASYLLLDHRLGQIVANTNETLLGQMRMAWWRETLALPVAERPPGDEVLDALGLYWAGNESSLIATIDAWEALLVAEEFTATWISDHAHKRAAPLVPLLAADDTGLHARVVNAGALWAIGDAAAHLSNEAERGAFVAAGLGLANSHGGLRGSRRGLAVLSALALRALRRGGRPLMEGRGAALTAIRAGLIGR